jgi:Ca2+/Na+ antiporter
MHDRLKKIYFIVLTPALVGFLAVWLLRQAKPAITVTGQHMAVMAPAIFIMAAIFAIAGPILYRSLFAHRQRNRIKVPQVVLYGFERNLTGMALVTPYLALVGYFLQLTRFHLAATLFLALYAVYYYYPSRKRIAFDGKLFRGGMGWQMIESEENK